MNLSDYRKKLLEVEKELKLKVQNFLWRNPKFEEPPILDVCILKNSSFNETKFVRFSFSSSLFEYEQDPLKIGQIVQYYYQGEFKKELIELIEKELAPYELAGYNVTFQTYPDDVDTGLDFSFTPYPSN